MPIFEYKCKKCGTVSEFLVPVGKNPKQTCQKCGSKDTEKMFSTFAVGVKQDGTDSKCFGCSDGGCPHAK